MSTEENLIKRIYSGFRGADFRGEEVNLVRSPDCYNVWRNYKKTDGIETRPEMELLESFDNTVWGVFFFKDEILVHSGTELYRAKMTKNEENKLVIGDRTLLWSNLREGVSYAFVYRDVERGKVFWYFKDGKYYLQYDGTTIKTVDGDDAYVPTTSIARKTESGGTAHEDVNMLNGRRINTFLSDGNSKEYWLDARNIDINYPPIVMVVSPSSKKFEKKKEGTDYTVDYVEGIISFSEVISDESILTDGQDNISVEFKKTTPGYADNILKCTLLQVFDNRVFFSGNPDYPNYVWHCSLNDPSYCSDKDYYGEGMDDASIKGLVAGNNALWVFREPSDSNTTVFYHTPALDSDYGKIYPSSHSSVTTGCIGKAINFNDDIVFFSERGMEGISGDITTEQVLGHRSTLVDSKLTAEPKYKEMILEEWEGYLLVFIDNKVYLADSRASFANGNHIEYEWFYWEMKKNITCTRVNDGVLYLGAEDGVYALTDTTSDVESYWVTPKDKFTYPHRLKTTNKRGCVVEATGDIEIYAKLEDTVFELVGEYQDIRDYFVSRIKRKKFKDIQLKFYSKTRFSLETATLEAFVGGYIKRLGVVKWQ